MISEKLPLAEDVTLSELATHDFAGGGIKNIVLNAVRYAATRAGEPIQVTTEDFQKAVTWEQKAQVRSRPIGFESKHRDN